jgi:hypothetical protein
MQIFHFGGHDSGRACCICGQQIHAVGYSQGARWFCWSHVGVPDGESIESLSPLSQGDEREALRQVRDV